MIKTHPRALAQYSSFRRFCFAVHTFAIAMETANARMPKTNRSGQAQTLDPEQLDAIMAELSPIARAALSTCRFTACRVSEGLQLNWGNITQSHVVIPKAITKKKVRTRSIPLNPRLAQELADWKIVWAKLFGREPEKTDYIFPGAKDPTTYMTRQNIDHALRTACNKLGIEGASTHSFRRSALTAASDAGLPLRHIQELSGHSSLAVLQTYLQCSEQQKRAVAMAFG